MKKLLAILTTVSLSLTATVSTVACNTKSNYKDNKHEEYEKEKELDEKQKTNVMNGINDLLSDLKYEFIDDGSKTHITGEKSQLDIKIDKTDENLNIKNKKYITIDSLTKTIKNDDQFSPWDTHEIITAFALAKTQLPDDHEIKNKINIGDYKWDPYAVIYIEGTVSIKHVDKGPINHLVWKMGYLNKTHYYESLFDMAINNYFDGDTDKYEKEDKPFKIKAGFEFNKNWINDIISKIIDSKNFVKELVSRFKNIKLLILKERKNDKGTWDEVPGEIWSPENYPNSQYVAIYVNFLNDHNIRFSIYIQPE